MLLDVCWEAVIILCGGLYGFVWEGLILHISRDLRLFLGGFGRYVGRRQWTFGKEV